MASEIQTSPLIKQKKMAFALTTSFFLLMTGFGSCSVSVEQACQTKLPEFQRRLEAATHEVAQLTGSPYKGAPGEGYRAIASIGPAISGPPHFSNQQKYIWEDWAEIRLKEVQTYLDAVKSEPRFGKQSSSVRKELSGVAEEMVAFDAFTEQKKVPLMLKALKNARRHLDSAAQIACPVSVVKP